MLKKISLVLISILYIGAGINHFRNPGTYHTLIPGYFPFPETINIISGILEILFAVLLWFPKTRKVGAYGIIALLIAFIPTHILMIQEGWCTASGYCFPLWMIWLRLLPLQFLLMLWAWWHRK